MRDRCEQKDARQRHTVVAKKSEKNWRVKRSYKKKTEKQRYDEQLAIAVMIDDGCPNYDD